MIAAGQPSLDTPLRGATQDGPRRRGAADPVLSVIVPTRHESANIDALLSRLAQAALDLSAEVIFVDDSDDDTPAVITQSARSASLPVRLIHRPSGDRAGGLSGAVIAGAAAARGEWVLVMDADLQHPPEVALALARTAIRTDVDVVAGTRYAGHGNGEGLDGGGRAATSSVATRLTKAVFPRRLATISDPMSGLFAFRRSAIDLDRLNPIGFKILLEMLVRHPGARVAEVAYEFAPRHAGESKASLREGWAFVRHMVRLRRGVLGRQLAKAPRDPADRMRQLLRLAAFGLVGASGMVVNTLVLWALHHGLGRNELIAATLATQVSTSWNFALTELAVYRGKGEGTWRGRALRFFAMNNVLLLTRLPAIVVLMGLGLGVLWANALTLVALFLVRFLISDRVIYANPGSDTAGEGADAGQEQTTRDPVRQLIDLNAPEEAGTGSRKRSPYLNYRYDIAGVVRIGSAIQLPELEFFRAQWVAEDDLDITIRVGDVGKRLPRRRAEMTEHSPDVAGEERDVVIRYEEHLGRWGANFRVEMGEQIAIEVGPLLAASPHVVYTNIVEALLRFVMVSRGRMLLHSACLELDGVGVMLSALTDTGKTATIMRLLREHGGQFLSDDMTIVSADGTAMCFPKPLTISAHTLRAVNANDLTPKEWRRLQFQSRLHSKGGRSFALTLAKLNLPIMGINAIVQRLIPPPKYTVDRLIGAQFGARTKVRDLFIIERGPARLAELSLDETVAQMLTNTDDAYGFPPFKYFAPAVRIGGQGYTQLRAREREILTGFLSNVHCRALASDNFGWSHEIPKLVAEGTAELARKQPGPQRHQITLPAEGDDLLLVPARREQSWSAEAENLLKAHDDAWPRWGGLTTSGRGR